MFDYLDDITCQTDGKYAAHLMHQSFCFPVRHQRPDWIVEAR